MAAWTKKRIKLRDSREHLLALTSELGEKILEFRGLAAEKIGEVFHAFDSEMGKVVDHLGGPSPNSETPPKSSQVSRFVWSTSRATWWKRAGRSTSRSHEDSRAFEKGAGEIADKLNTGRLELVRASEALRHVPKRSRTHRRSRSHDQGCPS